MFKTALGPGILVVLLSACGTSNTATSSTQQQTSEAALIAQQSHLPKEEILGIEPRYESYNPGTLQDYSIKGKKYKIIKDTKNFTQTGKAVFYGEELRGSRTALGEPFNPDEYTAAHPTLPLPSYVRVTNLNNGRKLVVRVNDRGPFNAAYIIDLSKAAADRLNIKTGTNVRIDAINVAPDGSLSGPGTVGTEIVRQSFALPDRPDLAPAESGTAPAIQTPVLPATNLSSSYEQDTLTESTLETTPGSPVNPLSPGTEQLPVTSALPAGQVYRWGDVSVTVRETASADNGYTFGWNNAPQQYVTPSQSTTSSETNDSGTTIKVMPGVAFQQTGETDLDPLDGVPLGITASDAFSL